ncbi:uncharacterized protein PRCAT00000925001 [Priceomyces carsonii]|uniref:uncharacterized protein n=1 Tax=Priceomyces carsonii TaxID=28549 RepID=UPI002EDB9AAF|nr:unnamed protein product [Priceomyces carsonii]
MSLRRFSSFSILQHKLLSKRFTEALSLEEFLFRKKVLETYKEAMRLCYKSHEKDDLTTFLRDEFKLNAQQKDLTYRKYLFSMGIQRIDQLTYLLGDNNKSK